MTPELALAIAAAYLGIGFIVAIVFMNYEYTKHDRVEHSDFLLPFFLWPLLAFIFALDAAPHVWRAFCFVAIPKYRRDAIARARVRTQVEDASNPSPLNEGLYS